MIAHKTLRTHARKQASMWQWIYGNVVFSAAFCLCFFYLFKSISIQFAMFFSLSLFLSKYLDYCVWYWVRVGIFFPNAIWKYGWGLWTTLSRLCTFCRLHIISSVDLLASNVHHQTIRDRNIEWHTHTHILKPCSLFSLLLSDCHTLVINW